MCFDVRSEADIEGFDGSFHALAVSADDGSVQDCGWFGDGGDVFSIVELGQVVLGWEE